MKNIIKVFPNREISKVRPKQNNKNKKKTGTELKIQM